ncbi:MAG TPA: META domain-containing protein [Dongiaceae bacterium]|nr:META domain-containing protein [Dongiaceae bacterium]
MLILFLAACASAPSRPQPSIVGLWAAQEVAGTPVPGDAHVTLSLYGNGLAVGRGGCNNYTTRYKRADADFSFGPVTSTKMACAPDIMSQEQSFLSTLAAVTHAERRPDGTLALTTDSGAQILFRRDEPANLQDARARGIDFRAVGQEPTWVVELKEGDHITALLDYGATSLLLPTPSAETADDGTVTYDASTDTDHLILTIKGKTCVNAMSGESHPSTVELMVNDKAYHGCGNWLD